MTVSTDTHSVLTKYFTSIFFYWCILVTTVKWFDIYLHLRSVLFSSCTNLILMCILRHHKYGYILFSILVSAKEILYNQGCQAELSFIALYVLESCGAVMLLDSFDIPVMWTDHRSLIIKIICWMLLNNILLHTSFF